MIYKLDPNQKETEPEKIAKILSEYFRNYGLPTWTGDGVSVVLTEDGEYVEVKDFDLEDTK